MSHPWLYSEFRVSLGYSETLCQNKHLNKKSEVRSLLEHQGCLLTVSGGGRGTGTGYQIDWELICNLPILSRFRHHPDALI